MANLTFQAIHPRSFLSFGPETGSIPLQALNVLIGPNGSGKSNFIEAFELLRAAPSDLAGYARQSGGAGELLWKGSNGDPGSASVAAVMSATTARPEIRYHLGLAEVAFRPEIIDESIIETTPRSPDQDLLFYYRFEHGQPVIRTRAADGQTATARRLKREDVDPQLSVLSQRRDVDLYPEVTSVGQTFARIETFREWSFGRSMPIRQPQRADLPTDTVLPDVRNLGLVLNDLEHSDRWKDLNALLRRFLPRFTHLSTRVQAAHVQIYLHEEGLRAPIPATRISDGTLRFIALLAILIRPEKASLICIEEPELGLHPDAVSLMASLLIEASQVTQMVVTTHSDVLVSALSNHPDSVLVAEHMAASTHLFRLETAKLRYWLNKYRLGEIWRMGQLGGNP